MHWFRRRQLAPSLQAYTDHPLPSRKTFWREVPFSVLDVETSGLDYRKDALLAIGLVEIEQGRIHLDRTWQSLIRPPEGVLVNAPSIRIHGLLRAELAQAPPIEQVLQELLEYLRGRILVVHVAEIDVRFLEGALKQHFGGGLQRPILDTARLALHLHHTERWLSSRPSGPAPAMTLPSLAQRLDLPVYPQHDPLNDALTAAQVFLAQATRLAALGYATLHDLRRAGGF